MAAKKFAISVPEDVMEQVDRVARARGVTRSRFIADLLRHTARARTASEITRRINRMLEDPELSHEQRETARAYRSRTRSGGTDW